ncbi:Uncharacterised protein [Cedecea neteri]|uniref:Alcohol dehydrogenase n=2 Tax=Cedecea neteri TaxID=158822 RepID=A0A291E619_9ENTR|nr:hypothetical protein [Cedecea neteri]ATF95383.1 hypothetical protein CO704_25145 [Cedecea neteri]SQC91963.1 Uncharacterised protein [Cedecea neteri]
MTLRHFVYNELSEADDKDDLAELIGLVADGRLRVDIQLADWSTTDAVLQQIQAGQMRGKAVFTLDH